MSSLQFSMDRIPDILHDYIFSGGILKGGSWGGKECKETITSESHYIELILWFFICLIVHRLSGYNYQGMLRNAEIILKNHERSPCSQVLDVVFGCFHFGIWLLVLYYKITLHSLINLCQPCHIALFVQGLGAVVGGSQGAAIGIISLPLVIGPIGALAVPALDGLDQPYEKLFFFIQHYLLLVTPLFLLLRNNYCAYKLVTFRSLIYANWTILVLHWFFFAPVDRYFAVNVNFMLCPSEGMNDGFTMLPAGLLWPSYRTVIVSSFFLASFPICYIYIGVSRLIIFFIRICLGEKIDRSGYRNSGKNRLVNGSSKIDNRHSLHDRKVQ